MQHQLVFEHVEQVKVNGALLRAGRGRWEPLIDDEVYGVDHGRRGERMTHTVWCGVFAPQHLGSAVARR